MIFKKRLESFYSRVAFIGVVLLTCALFVYQSLYGFAIAVVSDYRMSLSHDVLAQAALFFPGSPSVQSKFAESELKQIDRRLPEAEAAAMRAVVQSPYSFKYRAILAEVLDAEGKKAKAEQSFSEALRLGPGRSDLHWKYGNFLLRQGKISAALPHFKIATSLNQDLLREALSLVSRATNGDLESMKSIISGDSGSRFILASFLLRDSKTKEAVTVFEGIRASEALGIPESSSFVDDLITHNNLAEARDVWSRLRTDGEKPALLNNPSFEKDIDQRWRQFDWVFRDSKYARITIDNAEAHSGRQSLRIDFAGLDTTNLDQEIGQLVVLLPGRHYRLECFAKTRGLITTEYPVMVITDRSFKWVAASRSIGADINDWQHLIIDFVTPSASGEVPLYVSIKRKPRFSFDEPTKGTIWLDDFALVETGQ